MCLLHLGTNSTDKPTIRIINYDFINPGTIIKVSFGAIQSLAAPLSNTISLGVKMYYNDAKNSSTFLYILTPVLPTPTIATSLDTTRLSGWAWNFWHSFLRRQCRLATDFIYFVNDCTIFLSWLLALHVHLNLPAALVYSDEIFTKVDYRPL